MRAFPFISLLPFVFLIFSIAGIVLITLGVRGRPIFAAPRCRKCGYDLRNISFASDDVGNCPECGTTLSSPDAVTFGRWRRQAEEDRVGRRLRGPAVDHRIGDDVRRSQPHGHSRRRPGSVCLRKRRRH
jgi:hypothetical protein